jgi:uncharacterized protein (DUF1330 family)
MEVINSVYPNKEQIEGFLEPGAEGPICMVNLLKFKPRAEYEDGRETGLTGREAYEMYGEGIKDLLQQVGGYVGFEGDVERLMLGEVGELWDVVCLAVWPSRQAMFEVMQSEGIQEISLHRAAGLAGQLNIETAGFSGQWINGECQ